MVTSPMWDAEAFRYAEWLELLAIKNWPKPSSQADLRSLLEGADDDLALFDDPSELDDKVEEIVQGVFEELGGRCVWAGKGYPFKVEAGSVTLLAKPDQIPDGHIAYLFSLLVSFYRLDYYKRLPSPKPDNDHFPNAEKLEDYFQACGTIAAAGLVNGHSVSFGHPRPDKTSFYEKLTEISIGLCDGAAKEAWSEGASSNPKDAGVDIVAWREFADKQPGQIYLLGQCASGENWTKKSPLSDYDNFHEYYWTIEPHSPIIAAIFVPFDIRHDITVGKHSTLAKAWHSERWRLTKGLGIIVDRFRLANYFAQGVGIAENKCFKIESADMLNDLKAWVMGGMAFLRA